MPFAGRATGRDGARAVGSFCPPPVLGCLHSGPTAPSESRPEKSSARHESEHPTYRKISQVVFSRRPAGRRAAAPSRPPVGAAASVVRRPLAAEVRKTRGGTRGFPPRTADVMRVRPRASKVRRPPARASRLRDFEFRTRRGRSARAHSQSPTVARANARKRRMARRPRKSQSRTSRPRSEASRPPRRLATRDRAARDGEGAEVD
jgi:hypothetical protein